MHAIEKRTLSYIAEVHGLSRERVRQIIVKAGRIMRFRKHLNKSDRQKAAWNIGHLPLSARTQNALVKNGWHELSILLFVGLIKPKEFLSIPHVGEKAFKELYRAIKEVDEDAAYIWTSGNGEDYHAAKHGRRSFIQWHTDEQNRIFGIHKEGRDGGEGEGSGEV
jgi:hypothetical protein